MKGLAAWREQRLDLSPSLIGVHLRNYYRELRRPATPASGDERAPARPAPHFSATGGRCLLIVAIHPEGEAPGIPVRAQRMMAGLLDIGHGVTLFAVHERERVLRLQVDPRVTILAADDSAKAHLRDEGRSYDWVVVYGHDLGVKHLIAVRAFATRARVLFEPVCIAAGSESADTTAPIADPRISYCLSGADLVIARSQWELSELRTLEPSTPITMVPDGPLRADSYRALFPGDAMARRA